MVFQQIAVTIEEWKNKMSCFKPGTGNRKLSTIPGFTLIEILVVVAIIGILSGIISNNLRGAKIKAREASALQNARQLDLAVSLFEIDKGYYPGTLGVETNQDDQTTGWKEGPGTLHDDLVPKYISKLPTSDEIKFIYLADEPCPNDQTKPCRAKIVIDTDQIVDGDGGTPPPPPPPAKVIVPDLVNKTEAEALGAISAANLAVGFNDDGCSDMVSSGYVFSQSLTAGASVDEGTAINIVVSAGGCISPPPVGSIPISSCGTIITQPGDYHLALVEETELNQTNSGICIYVNNVDNVNLDCQNIKIKGTDTTESSKQYGVIVGNSSGVAVKNCLIENVGTGIRVYSSDNISIENNRLSNLGREGMYLKDNSDVIIRNNQLTNAGARAIAIYREWASLISGYAVDNNTIKGGSYGITFGHLFTDSRPPGEIKEIVINGNNLYDIVTTALSLNLVENLSIINNYIYDPKIFLQIDDSKNLLIDNNFGQNITWDMFIGYSDNVTFSNNKLKSASATKSVVLVWMFRVNNLDFSRNEIEGYNRNLLKLDDSYDFSIKNNIFNSRVGVYEGVILGKGFLGVSGEVSENDFYGGGEGVSLALDIYHNSANRLAIFNNNFIDYLGASLRYDSSFLDLGANYYGTTDCALLRATTWPDWVIIPPSSGLPSPLLYLDSFWPKGNVQTCN